MRKRSERSIVLSAVIFVFVCLLFSGGSRLIGHEGESPVPAQSASFANTALSAAPVPLGETGHVPAPEAAGQRMVASQRVCRALRPAHVLSDANGNVLRGCSYLKSVYQAFSLGDGFV